jgi:predicted RNA binding protein YcfA (HicA-like mRNA interferase family)
VGQRKYPCLTPSEVISVLEAIDFKLKRTTGSHSHYECEQGKDGKRHVVTVDTSVDEFREDLMKSMIRQSGRSREEFYGATKRTRKKIH